MPTLPIRALNQLAILYGVQTAYDDANHQRCQATPEVLLTLLQLLGAPVATFNDAPSALRQRQQALWQRCIEPVDVVWEKRRPALRLRLPVALENDRACLQLQLESGHSARHIIDFGDLAVIDSVEVEGTHYVTKQLVLPEPLPWGYHRLTLERGNDAFKSLLIAAPRKAFAPTIDPEGSPEPRNKDKTWGVFLPLYALHTQHSWGAGDFSDLESLTTWTAEQGGDFVATLPLLSAFLDQPYDPSPYAPASRLFWNEFYIDVARIPEFARCDEAKALLSSTAVQSDITALRMASQIDHRRQMALKRHILERLADHFFTHPSERHAAFQQFLDIQPHAADYARFRAAGERHQAPWVSWPAPLRDGVLADGDYDDRAYRYHQYVQWIAHEQVTAVANHSKAAGVQLYLDLPLGVHPDSYDVWRERDAFCLGAAAGAPPDLFFTKGQNWGFPPLHPEAIRTQGYRYVIAYLRHQLQYAGLLRIDHVMGLHRLFCIPQGIEAKDGVYIRYAADELYAIVNLESHRQQTGIIGENLGTVPSYVNRKMARHHLHRMYVLQYALGPDPHQPLQPVPAETVASLNTHDMPTFAAFWDGLDITDRQALGLLDQTGADEEQRQRETLKAALKQYLESQGWLQDLTGDGSDVFAACLRYLAASPAQTVLVNLEDMWGETNPQNVPGTATERPNWRQKSRFSFEQFRDLPLVLDRLQDLHSLRQPPQES